MEQASEAGGPDANRYFPALAKNRGRQLLLRDVDHDALTQLDGGEVRQIAIERDLVVRAAVRVVKNGAWHATACFLAQVFDAVKHWHRLKRGQIYLLIQAFTAWRDLRSINRSVPFSDYATTEALFARPHFTALRTIPALAIRADRIDGRALRCARLREDRRYVRREASLERLRGHEYIVAEAVFVQRLSFDDQRLGVRALQFDRAGHEAFHRVGDIVRLIEHVCRPEVGRIRELGLDQFIEDQEQAEGLDRAGVEIVVAVLRIVEMKTAEALRMHQTRDDHFDVHVRRVVPQVHQAKSLRAECLRCH